MKIKEEQFQASLKRLRLRQGMSQEELARRAGLKLSNLAKLEGGFNSNPTLATLHSLAKVLTKGNIDQLSGAKSNSSVKDISGLGANIKRFRQQQGMSQEELARSADLKLSNLAKLEGGFNSNPTLASLRSIAKVLSQGSINRLLAK